MRALLFFVVLLCWLPSGNASTTSEANGLRITASYWMVKYSMKANEVDPSKPYPQQYGCYVHVRVENVSDHRITVVTRPSDFQEERDGRRVVYRFVLKKFHRRPLRPSLYRFDPITLGPGEIAELPQTVCSGGDQEALKPTSVVYDVVESFAAMLDVWGGKIETEPIEETWTDYAEGPTSRQSQR